MLLKYNNIKNNCSFLWDIKLIELQMDSLFYTHVFKYEDYKDFSVLRMDMI